MSTCQIDHEARFITAYRQCLEQSQVRCSAPRIGFLMQECITNCLYTWCLCLSLISLLLSLLISFSLCPLYPLFLPLLILGLFYSAFGKSLCTYKRYWKWCPRASIQAWTLLILFVNTFSWSAFGKLLSTYKSCWKWCPRASIQAWTKSAYRSISAQRISERIVYASFTINLLTPELHPSAQRCLPGFFTGDLNL
jgi:hypothetical protein